MHTSVRTRSDAHTPPRADASCAPTRRRITWLQIDEASQRSYHSTDKRTLCARKGLHLPVSDLRVLDPAYTAQRRGCVLARDRCLVVCLEHVRLIVMRDCVLLPLERHAGLTAAQARLVDALERQIREHAGETGALLRDQ